MMEKENVKDTICNLLSEELKLQNISKETELDSLGLNSITYIKLIVAIEKKFDIEFDDDELAINNFATLNDLINRVEEMCN